jgi:pyruvate/2-oxoglutarate/acetoin dehydrogenase E1 component
MKLNYGGAIREALHKELKSEIPTVFLGQDLHYNIYGYTENLVNDFGEEIVINTPISENSVVGMAIGAAICGVRTIVDLTVANFLYMAMDQIVNMASKNAYMYNGAFKLPITIMCGEFYDVGNAAQHSDRLHSMFINFPGLKIVAPASPQDAYSLLRSGINDNNPVLYFSDRSLFYSETEVDLDMKIDLGRASLIEKNENSTITIVAISGSVKLVVELISDLKKMNIFIDLIDLRSIVPLDFNLIFHSVKRTGRIVIVDTANRSGSIASHISSVLSEDLFDFLKAPIGIVAFEDVPVPFANNLEKLLMPTKDKIYNKILQIVNYLK